MIWTWFLKNVQLVNKTSFLKRFAQLIMLNDTGMAELLFYLVSHRSIQSQLQTKNLHGIWHMPNYSLVSWVPKTGKNKKSQRRPKKLGPIKVFSL